MCFYLFLFLFILFFALCFPQSKKIGLLCFGVLCFFSMFRGAAVGTDTATYMDIHRMMQIYDYDFGGYLSRSTEIITYNLYKFIYIHSLSPRLVIVFFSLVTFSFLFLSIKRMRLSYGVAAVIFLILFYLSSFNIARQICACSIVLYAFTYLFEDSNKKYLYFVYVILASLIHAASFFYVILFLFRLIRNFPLSRKALTIFASLLFVFNIVSPFNVSEYLTSLLGNISFSEIYSDRAVTSSRSIMGIMQDLAKFVVLIYVFNYSGTNKRITLFDLFFYLSIIATIFSANSHSDFARVFLPLLFFQIIYLPYLYKTSRRFIKSLSFMSFVFVYTFFTLWGAAMGSGEVIPYVLYMSF